MDEDKVYKMHFYRVAKAQVAGAGGPGDVRDEIRIATVEALEALCCEHVDSSVMETPIKDIGLSRRSLAPLVDADISVVGELVEKTPRELLSLALRAICLTRDYVGEEILPPIDGWEWYEAGKKLADSLGDDEWAEEFRKRCERGPQGKRKGHNTEVSSP